MRTLKFKKYLVLALFVSSIHAFADSGNISSASSANSHNAEANVSLSDLEIEKIVNQNQQIEKPGVFDFITNLPSDFGVWGKETFRKDNIPTLLAITGMTGIATMTDYETWQAVRRPYLSNENFKKFADFGEYISNGNFIVGMTAGFLLAGTVDTNRRALRTAEQIIESLLASGVVVQVIKRSTGRESPNSSTQRTGHWSLFPNQRDYQKDYQSHDAMPSGHLSTAMTAFIVVKENYPEQKWIPWVGYPLMGWVCIGLSASGIHWWSDFPIALALGYHFARVVTRNNYPELRARESKYIPELMPTWTDLGEPMLQAQWRW